jgi:hypothetical protein
MTNSAINTVRHSNSFRFGWRLLLTVMGLAAAGVTASAANRTIGITAPASAVAGSKINVTVTAGTDAGGGERIGFFHADYSVDNGVTWTAISYATNEGTTSKRSATFTAGAAGSKAMVRIRVAFRGGKAGDVDFTGKPIAWESSWGKWEEPPAKTASIAILAK